MLAPAFVEVQHFCYPEKHEGRKRVDLRQKRQSVNLESSAHQNSPSLRFEKEYLAFSTQKLELWKILYLYLEQLLLLLLMLLLLMVMKWEGKQDLQEREVLIEILRMLLIYV